MKLRLKVKGGMNVDSYSHTRVNVQSKCSHYKANISIYGSQIYRVGICTYYTYSLPVRGLLSRLYCTRQLYFLPCLDGRFNNYMCRCKLYFLFNLQYHYTIVLHNIYIKHDSSITGHKPNETLSLMKTLCITFDIAGS